MQLPYSFYIFNLYLHVIFSYFIDCVVQIMSIVIFQTYSSRDLKGLKVEHDISNFREGQTVILTLKDRGEDT